MKPKTNMKLEPEEYYMSLWRYPIPTNGNFQNIVNNILMNLLTMNYYTDVLKILQKKLTNL